MGPMHDKHAELSKLVQAHMAPLYEELVALSVKIGVPLLKLNSQFDDLLVRFARASVWLRRKTR
jgi:hypothetical protein